MALQRGALGTDDDQRLGRPLAAARVAARLRRRPADRRIQLRVRRREPGRRRTRQTFDQLYPTAHDKYGLADQIGWKNMHHAPRRLRAHAVQGLPVTTNYHSWWLATADDGLYNARAVPCSSRESRGRRRHPRRPGDRRAGVAGDHAAASGRGGLRPHLHRRVPARRPRQAPPTATPTSWSRTSSWRRSR